MKRREKRICRPRKELLHAADERAHNKAPLGHLLLSTWPVDGRRNDGESWVVQMWSLFEEASRTRREHKNIFQSPRDGLRLVVLPWQEETLHSWNLIPGRDEHEISSSHKITSRQPYLAATHLNLRSRYCGGCRWWHVTRHKRDRVVAKEETEWKMKGYFSQPLNQN